MGTIEDWFASVLADPVSARGYLFAYGFLALSHILVQYTFALFHGVRIRQLEKIKASHRREHSAPLPKRIVVWVPVYQEKPEWLEACLRNLAIAAEYFARMVPGGQVTIIVMDDGSYQRQLTLYSEYIRNGMPPLTRSQRVWNRIFRRKPVDPRERYRFYQRKRWELEAILTKYRNQPYFDIPAPTGKNVGKRHAQQGAWLRGKLLRLMAQLYVTVDSDTALANDAILRLAENFRNPDVAAATGYVDVGNWNRTWLTRLIDMRYWSAFHVERAAQSFWRCVMCCSGPLAAYRASVADAVMERYANQRFLGNLCTFGDDRHLTNLILEMGYLVVMDPRAHCLTDVPERVRDYIPQQKRWSMSFYREMLWSLGALKSHSMYMTYDLVMQFCLPFLLLGGLGVTVYLAVIGDAWATITLYVATIFVVGFVRSLYPFFARRPVRGQEDQYGWGRKFSQLLFMGYGVLHVTVLTPVRLWALVSLFQGTTAWGTRKV